MLYCFNSKNGSIDSSDAGDPYGNPDLCFNSKNGSIDSLACNSLTDCRYKFQFQKWFD